MNAQQVAELTVLLEGIPLPAKRRELIEYAAQEDRDAAEVLRRRLPDREFDRLDAVGEALRPAPHRPRPPEKLPGPESGKPPGGDDYLRPFPEPGAVRPSAPKDHPQTQALEQQAKTQQRQQKRQSS